MIMAIPAIRYATVCSNRVLKPVLTISSPGVQEATASPMTHAHAMNLSAMLGFFIRPLCNENGACRNFETDRSTVAAARQGPGKAAGLWAFATTNPKNAARAPFHWDFT